MKALASIRAIEDREYTNCLLAEPVIRILGFEDYKVSVNYLSLQL